MCCLSIRETEPFTVLYMERDLTFKELIHEMGCPVTRCGHADVQQQLNLLVLDTHLKQIRVTRPSAARRMEDDESVGVLNRARIVRRDVSPLRHVGSDEDRAERPFGVEAQVVDVYD